MNNNSRKFWKNLQHFRSLVEMVGKIWKNSKFRSNLWKIVEKIWNNRRKILKKLWANVQGTTEKFWKIFRKFCSYFGEVLKIWGAVKKFCRVFFPCILVALVRNLLFVFWWCGNDFCYIPRIRLIWYADKKSVMRWGTLEAT